MTRQLHRWTTEQLARLAHLYPVMAIADLVIEFAPHPWSSIETTANANGIFRRNSKLRWQQICGDYLASRKPRKIGVFE